MEIAQSSALQRQGLAVDGLSLVKAIQLVQRIRETIQKNTQLLIVIAGQCLCNRDRPPQVIRRLVRTVQVEQHQSQDIPRVRGAQALRIRTLERRYCLAKL